ncbi:TrmB family transcriptional regulator [Halobium palmae]|uniref:TrmB family transcriptional regulator n=1 Tax=Halobium palmae TaxID=1776492 RepID=A0ABD5RYJ3_9EURY
MEGNDRRDHVDAGEEYERAVDLLQELGLKEYESKCFAVLSGRSKATAKVISERSEVPRTRVYDAIRVLEAKGLVEVQHSNPQQFRAIPIEEALATLRKQYETRFDELQTVLEGLDTGTDTEERAVHEVWAISGTETITNRTLSLVDEAAEEILFIAGDESVLSPTLLDRLNGRKEEGLTVILGAATASAEERLHERVPDAETFRSGLEWLHGPLDGSETEEASIDRLLLVDRSTILVSTKANGGTEHAVFGRGFGNGMVVILRRLMATGLLPNDDPGIERSE